MRIRSAFAFLILLFFGFNAVAQSPDKAFDYGQLKGSTYTNAFFGFKVNVPETWIAKTEEQKKQMQELGGELLAGDNAALKTMVKAAQVKTANLLAVSQYEQGAPVDFNPSFGIIAENMTNSPGVKSGNDYLFHAKKVLELSQIKYSFDKEVYNRKIGGQEFAVLETTLIFPTAKVSQHFYVTVKNNYSLIFMNTFLTKENKKELDKILETVAFQ